MDVPAIYALVLYYACVGMFCGVMFAEAVGLPFTSAACKKPQSLLRLAQSVTIHIFVWPVCIYYKYRELVRK